MPDGRFCDDDGCLSVSGGANFRWLIVAMKRIERNAKTSATRFPLGALSNGAVGYVAQRAMPSTKTCANPIRQLTTKRRVSVVHSDETHDPLIRGLTR